MKLMRHIAVASTTAGIALLPMGGALAADVNINGTTGPDSNQNVVINNTSQVDETNVNAVVVTNTNVQEAVTGDVTASNNTQVDGLGSGNATNSNGTATTVTVNNPSVLGESVVAPGGSTQQPGTVVGGFGGRGNGTVLGASAPTGGLGGGQAVLPSVGPSMPVDVSALRAAWQQQSAAPTTEVVNQTRGSSWLMFALATLLGVLGGISNLVYLRRKEGRI
jgi:hypothetical protein